MKWVVVVLALVVAGAVAVSLTGGRDESCPGSVVGSAGPLYDESYAGEASPDAALGTALDGAVDVTQERDTAKGFETVTFRGYDADDELVGLVVAEHRGRGWFRGRSESCDRS